MIAKLRRQQAAIADFGSFAFRQNDLTAVLDEAARVCAEALNVRYSKVCRYREAEDDLIIETGYGWKKGVIGYVVGHPDQTTPQGRAFSTGKPATCNVLQNDDAFVLPPFYEDHGIISTIDVVIKGGGQGYGVLEIDSDEPQNYDDHDIDFLRGFANVLAEAVATNGRMGKLNSSVESMKRLMEEKDQLLDQKRLLAEELQHRVRNNLQLVGGMLNRQLEYTSDASGRRGLQGIIRRLFTLSQVYDQLLGSDMTRSVDFSAYLEALCLNLEEVQTPADGCVGFEFKGERVMLDLDMVTALGIIAAELVTNSVEHAFPENGGMISVALHYDAIGAMATMSINDDGIGFTPTAGSKRHGVGLIHRLSEQVGGSAEMKADGGTHWTITFPVTGDQTQDIADTSDGSTGDRQAGDGQGGLAHSRN